MRTLRVWLAMLAVVALSGVAYAGEPLAEPKDKPAEPAEPEDEGPIGHENDVVARVDDIDITRGELNQTRRIISIGRQGPLPNNQQILEQLINRALWNRHFDKKNLRPKGLDIQQAIRNLDARLRQRNSSYERFLIARGLNAEEHAGMLSYELAMRRLIADIDKDITDEQVKAEFEAHPEFYDGSRVHIHQIFIDTSSLGNDAKKLDEAKAEAEEIHKKLVGGGDFEQLARDFSDGAAAQRGGDRGWFRRKGPEVDEPLIEAAWELKPGEFTKPIRGARGWHVLKVSEREPAHFTFFGCKRRIRQALTRQKLEAVLDDLKAQAKIERLL